MQRRKGFTLIAAVFFFMVFNLLVINISGLVSAASVVAVNNLHSLEAFYIASAGMEFYLKELDGDNDWSSPPASINRVFSGGCFNVATADEAQDSITVTVTGLLTTGAQTFDRVIRAGLTRTSLGGGGYAAYASYGVGGSGTLTIQDNVTINGDIYVENDISLGNNVIVNGDLRSAGTISGDTSGVTGAVESGAAAPESPPAFDSSYYDGEVATAQSSGSPEPSWGNPVSGTYYINGWVNNLTGKTVSDNTKIVASGGMNLSSVAFGENCMIISGDQLTLGVNSTVGKGTTIYSELNMLLQGGLVGGTSEADGGIAMLSSSNLEINSTGTLFGYFHGLGTVKVMNNSVVTGNLVGGDFDTIQSVVTITLDTSVNNYSSIEGISVVAGATTLEVSGWQEIY